MKWNKYMQKVWVGFVYFFILLFNSIIYIEFNGWLNLIKSVIN